jgi:hypothetical protein
VYKNIVWCHSENNAPHHLKDVSFVKGVPDFDKPEHVPTLVVLDDLMDSAYSTKVREPGRVHASKNNAVQSQQHILNCKMQP